MHNEAARYAKHKVDAGANTTATKTTTRHTVNPSRRSRRTTSKLNVNDTATAKMMI